MTEIGKNELIKPNMPVLDYIKMFFPSFTFMYHVDEYIQMDFKYWAQYSEPVYLFLLATKYFFDEFTHIREECYSAKNNLSKLVTPLNGIAEVVFTDRLPHYVFSMSSTFDTIRYKAIRDIIGKRQYILVCPACGEVKESIINNQVFCSTKHQKAINQRNTRDNKKKNEKDEKRRIAEINRQMDFGR